MLNNYAVIVMSVTQEPYWEGGKTAVGICWQYLGLLEICSLITSFLGFFGYILTVYLPVLITIAIMSSLTPDDDEVVFVGVAVAVCCIFINDSVFVIITEGVSCTLVYYALDEGLYAQGLISARRMPKEVAREINSGKVEIDLSLETERGTEMK